MTYELKTKETNLTIESLEGAREQRIGSTTDTFCTDTVINTENSDQELISQDEEACYEERTWGCKPDTFVFGLYFIIFIIMVYIIINRGMSVYDIYIILSQTAHSIWTI